MSSQGLHDSIRNLADPLSCCKPLLLPSYLDYEAWVRGRTVVSVEVDAELDVSGATVVDFFAVDVDDAVPEDVLLDAWLLVAGFLVLVLECVVL